MLQPMQTTLVIARLRDGQEAAAKQLIEKGPAFLVAEVGLSAHKVFVSELFVGFLFEGPDVEQSLHNLLNDPTLSGEFGHWGPLIDGAPSLCPEAFSWASP